MAKILVIDDEQDIREKVCTMLEYEDFETLSAENGRKGIEIAKQSLPDLIVCDVMMPGVSGFWVLSELRNDTRTAGIPFIFLTGRASQKDMRHGMALGADDYLAKPFKTSDLLAAIHTRLEKHAAARQELENLRFSLSRALPHELKTPLSAIIGFSELLIHFGRQLEPSMDEIIEMQQSIYDSAIRLQQLIENHLLYARLRLIEKDLKQQQNWKSRSSTITPDLLASWIKQCVKIHHRQEDLRLKLQEDGCFYMCETDLLKIFEELIENACKFSERGTPIAITTQFTEKHAALTITDHGRGMTEEQITNIGAYVQFDRSQCEQQGLGLGLAIVRMLAQLYAGNISIQSEPKKGTTVIITFPQNQE